MATMIITEENDLKNLIKSAFYEFSQEQIKDKGEKLYNVNQIAKKLGKAHATIKKLILAGYIKTTASGLISEASLNEYLNKQ
jgi:hypothetical protein